MTVQARRCERRANARWRATMAFSLAVLLGIGVSAAADAVGVQRERDRNAVAVDRATEHLVQASLLLAAGRGIRGGATSIVGGGGGGETVNFLVTRWDGNSGTVMVTSAVPLKP